MVLFNVAVSGVVAQSPEPEARDKYARRRRFWRERLFLQREENPTESDWDQQILAHIRDQDRTQAAGVVGRWWWPLRQPDSLYTDRQTDRQTDREKR